MDVNKALFQFCLRRGDDTHVLSHRLGEWCGHGPVLEEDMALTNRALDLLGQARNYLQYAGQVEGQGRSEDDLAYLRNERGYVNCKLVEQPNGDYAHTIAKCFLFDAWHLPFLKAQLDSKDEQLAAIAGKAVKEATYHLRHSSEWMVRFGDGTEESHQRAQQALHDLWTFTGELFETDEVYTTLRQAGIVPDLGPIKEAFDRTVNEVLAEATLKRPEDEFMATGGRKGQHTEHLGHMLGEMQFLQRAHPGAQW